MKKLGNWIAMLMYMAIGGASGIVMVRGMKRLVPEDAGTGAELLCLGLLFLGFYAALMLHMAAHEGGHYVFGRLTGYRFVSYRVFNLMWLDDGSGVRLHRFSLAGTGGQCLMEPPGSPEERYPVVLYNLGGSLMNLMVAAACLALAWLLRGRAIASMLLNVAGVVGVGCALVNGLPLALSLVNNDGRNTVELCRSAGARRAFWIQMKINALTSRGTRLRDMPEVWFAVPDPEGMKSSLTASLAVFAANRLMDERRFAEADALMARILADPGATPGVYRALLVCDRIYCELIGPNRAEAVDAMLDKAQRKAMKALRGMPSVLRTEYALALLREGEAEKAEEVLRRFEALAKRYPYPVELEAERELMRLAAEGR